MYRPRLLHVMPFLAVPVLMCSTCTTSMESAPDDRIVTRHYMNYIIDQPNMPTLEDFRSAVEANVGQLEDWETGGAPNSIKHGPNHTLAIVAPAPEQTEVVNWLLAYMAQNSHKMPHKTFEGLLSSSIRRPLTRP